MSDVLLRPAPQAARLVGLRLLRATAVARARLGKAGDDEALHDFRVALRRLRSWLRAQRASLDDSLPRKLRKRLGRVADATGDLRDIEVLEKLLALVARPVRGAPERATVGALEALLRERREVAEPRAEHAGELFDECEDSLEEALGTWSLPTEEKQRPAPLALELARLVREQADELEAAIQRASSPELQAEAHEARIAGKRLRALIEPFAGKDAAMRGCVKKLKELQDLLGDMHDAHVLELAAASVADASPPVGAEALALRVRRRVERLHGLLRTEWLAGGAAVLRRRAHAIAASLEKRAGAGMEHERKYLLSAMPARALKGTRSLLEQGWLPGTRIQERLRRETLAGRSRYWRTIKAGRGLSRIEAEEEIASSLFRSLWPLTAGRRVRKERFVVRALGRKWEIDRFLDRSLVLAEVELPSADAEAPMPAWLKAVVVREVTGEDEYVNRNLAR